MYIRDPKKDHAPLLTCEEVTRATETTSSRIEIFHFQRGLPPVWTSSISFSVFWNVLLFWNVWNVADFPLIFKYVSEVLKKCPKSLQQAQNKLTQSLQTESLQEVYYQKCTTSLSKVYERNQKVCAVSNKYTTSLQKVYNKCLGSV